MILPGLPEGVDLLGYRPVEKNEFAWVLGAALPGPIARAMFVVVPLNGFSFQYDVTNDTYRVISTEGVIPSAATAANGSTLNTGDSATTVTNTVPTMNFNDALQAMKAGRKVARLDWKSRWLEHNDRMLPQIAQMPELAVWVHSKEDLAARDWVVIP